MIETVSDFLLSLRDKEVELLKKYEIIGHAPTIGEMYEGLTRDLLDKALFKGLQLKVTAGKIIGSRGQYSGEIDAMLVVGEGEKIPYTDKEIYPVEQVIAVVQVKKNLYSAELISSHQNLLSVTDTIESRDSEDYHWIMFKDVFNAICQREVPSKDELKDLDITLQHIYHSLLAEVLFPCKIVWGYNGFSSEQALRNAIVKYFGNNITTGSSDKKPGFSPATLPDLIICNKLSIVKNNGIPFGAPLTKDNWMHVYVSSTKNPLHFLLQMVWTRLQYMFALAPAIFGEDLTLEKVRPFLMARIHKKGDIYGWIYGLLDLNGEENKEHPGDDAWKPVLLTKEQYIIFYALSQIPMIIIDGKDIYSEVIKKHNLDPVVFSEGLRATGLIHIDETNIRLITVKIAFVFSEQGVYAAENKTGRLERWVKKHSPC